MLQIRSDFERNVLARSARARPMRTAALDDEVQVRRDWNFSPS